MQTDIADTIVALSSAVGTGARAIVRLSGPEALALAGSVFTAPQALQPGQRRAYEGAVSVPGIAASLPTDLYCFPAPRTYTGQEVVELHVQACPPLVELLIAELLRRGARAALPGEFTLRAFLAGKLDLPRAEAVLGVIEANGRQELRQALQQLAGGMTAPLVGLRDDLLNLLADLEAGLDFTEEDIHFIAPEELLKQLAKGLAQLTLLQKQLDQRSLSGRPFRVVIAGPPNVGKSSLFNALTGGSALVAPEQGTTRDYLVQRLDLDGTALDIVDTAGWQSADETIEEQAQHLGRAAAENADLILLCQVAGELPPAPPTAQEVLPIATKCDLATPTDDGLATSTHTGAGLDELRSALAIRARAHAQPPLAPSLSRCRSHVAACLEHLRRGHEMVLFEEPPELLAVEVRGALDQLGELVGAVYTDDLLDRIFSRFCIGK
ncbi:MAG: tRNA modification GTPase [Planctomycetia bacterium]|nr:tRNA modification GTPase [Planctomycetia bacterium]